MTGVAVANRADRGRTSWGLTSLIVGPSCSCTSSLGRRLDRNLPCPPRLRASPPSTRRRDGSQRGSEPGARSRGTGHAARVSARIRTTNAAAASATANMEWFAVSCPVCNKVVVALLGASGATSTFAPLQPALGRTPDPIPTRFVALAEPPPIAYVATRAPVSSAKPTRTAMSAVRIRRGSRRA